MKVMLVDPSTHGGIASYSLLLARALHAAGASGQLVVPRRSGTAPGFRSHQWLPTVRWGRSPDAGLAFYVSRTTKWMLSASAVAAAAVVFSPDVIHFQAPLNRRLDTALIRMLRRRWPVVWTAHDVLPPEPVRGDRSRFAAIYRTVDVVIVHGERAAAEITRLAGVQPVVIGYPAPPDLVRTDRAEARRRLRLPGVGRILAAIGFVRPYKGYDLLADVWEALGDSAPLLLVMGEVMADSERPVLERLARSPRAAVRTGYASEADLYLALHAVDALVLPYRSASESGLVHLARAVGVPVLASDAAQLSDTVRATCAGSVLPRTVGAWREAVMGPLPPPPPPPPALDAIGRAHCEAYARSMGGRRP